jgi:4-amino-4-deoxy-L-arabinose transferase-like glycosyltransferase
MLLHAHSGLRYLILLAGLGVVIYAAAGLIMRAPYKRPMRVLSSIFAGSLHLQVLLGLALLFSGRFYPALIGHIFLMILAAVVAQVVPSIMRRRREEERTYLPHLISGVVALGLIWSGVIAIGRGLLGSGIG